MSKNEITKEQINTTMALALMRYLYNQGKISEKVYKKILSQYGKKGLAESGTHANINVRTKLGKL